ncbi:MAG: hypothetical protein PWQ99_425 [Clostridia bacterium]|nr:hypothetical protein [Clostridia bacterium]
MKRPLFFCLVMLFSLMIIGAGYTSWSDTLLVNADAATGWLGVGIRCEGADAWMCGRCRCQEPERVNPPSVSYAEGPWVCAVSETDYYEYVDLFFGGGCNGCRITATLEIGNGGTIPARIKGISLDGCGNGCLQKWEVSLPNGYRENGSGIKRLQRAVRDVLLDPQQRMRIELQFHPGCSAEEASLSIWADACRWNDRG